MASATCWAWRAASRSRQTPSPRSRWAPPVATNALLERKGDRTLLLITQGFGDLLRIGYQNRPRLFDLHIRLPELLYERVVEVPERLDAAGEVVTPLDEAAARRALEAAKADGIDSVAIAFMHGYKNPDHEARVAAIAAETGFGQISVSHQISPLMKLVSRGDTTVVDAYLSPILRRYVSQVADELGAEPAAAPHPAPSPPKGGGSTGAPGGEDTPCSSGGGNPGTPADAERDAAPSPLGGEGRGMAGCGA